jgi:hypothetical protein
LFLVPSKTRRLSRGEERKTAKDDSAKPWQQHYGGAAMNPAIRNCLRFLSIALLVCTFAISSTMPLLANPPQSSQSQSGQSTMQSEAGQTNAGGNPSNTSSTSTANEKPEDSLPEAPQVQNEQTQQQTNAPTGAAGAKRAPVKGTPAAQPAGAAVAPVKQRGHRSLLIKLGLIAGAAIAVGAAIALSEKSPSRPPGSTTAAAQQ